MIICSLFLVYSFVIIMPLPEFIDEPILVQARLLPDGGAQPTAFIWRERTYLIADWGRQWQEEAGGAMWRCYLVRTPNLETFELRLNRAAGRWVLSRAWLKATTG
ncbi:MAG: DUF6504 family protein [Anaerolineae bacterium]|jgi:hypothetical protein|nr:DUF6504 family protein [Anaerolineae bacterium]